MTTQKYFRRSLTRDRTWTISDKELRLKKRRRRSIVAFDMIRLDRTSNEPLHLQLYRQIRDELKLGSFGDGVTRLPSSRALAADLGIGRLTVKLAFSKLDAEGYLAPKARSGTFVAYPLPESFLSAAKSKAYPAVDRPPRIADRVRALQDQRVGSELDLGVTCAGPGASLVPSIPAVDEFPMDTWERVRREILARKGAYLLRYASHRGDADLRKAIAAYLCDFRAARCHPDQIIIVNGMQQAILVSAMALLNPGQSAWIEDPGYHQARRGFALVGAKIVPKRVDPEGLVIERAPKELLPRIIYITPSHQFPLGMAMSLERRTALLDFARTHDAFIFEDDCDAEFRFVGLPFPSLQGIDNSNRVIYAGTMSKILYPSLRLGYMVAPERLADSMAKVRSAIDQHSPAIDQATLAKFISEGFFLSHIKRMRKIYAERRDFFIKQFNELLGNYFTLQIPEAGLNVVAWLKREEDFSIIRRLTFNTAVRPTALSFFCIEAKLKPAFVFGFAAWTPTQIRESLVKLASALKKKAI
jgi:GntR family transcriptional regulator / MocR family aminotransferase